MNNLTILYLTANEIPHSWAKRQIKILLKAAGDYPIISLSRKPMKLGTNILDVEEKNYLNIYRQMLIGAKHATTPYVAVAEDDVLYHKEHFIFHRPRLDTFAYDMSRWSLYLWKPNLYSMKARRSNCTLIAPRELLIEALEERFDKYPTMEAYGDRQKFIGEVGRNLYEKHLGLTQWNNEDVRCHVPCIQFNHWNGTDYKVNGDRKRLGELKAYNIPYWGEASKLAKLYENT
jgi:hypothetical protein